jgi:ATP-dependent Clp protease ATP-binding subunit ClpB
VTLELSPEALQKLADSGFDPAFGARPLRRIIQNELADPLARLLLEGQVREKQLVKVDVEKDGYKFSPKSIEK